MYELIFQSAEVIFCCSMGEIGLARLSRPIYAAGSGMFVSASLTLYNPLKFTLFLFAPLVLWCSQFYLFVNLVLQV